MDDFPLVEIDVFLRQEGEEPVKFMTILADRGAGMLPDVSEGLRRLAQAIDRAYDQST